MYPHRAIWTFCRMQLTRQWTAVHLLFTRWYEFLKITQFLLLLLLLCNFVVATTKKYMWKRTKTRTTKSMYVYFLFNYESHNLFVVVAVCSVCCCCYCVIVLLQQQQQNYTWKTTITFSFQLSITQLRRQITGRLMDVTCTPYPPPPPSKWHLVAKSRHWVILHNMVGLFFGTGSYSVRCTLIVEIT